MKDNIKNVLIPPQTTIKQALAILNESISQIMFVTGKKGEVVGSITDGDLRRALLGGYGLDATVEKAARPSFIWVKPGTPDSELLNIMKKKGIKQIPILDSNHFFIDLKTIDDLTSLHTPKEISAVIMAGGKGTRLLPHTETIPKPLIKIGKQTMIERLINSLRAQGISDLHITVKYLAQQIIDYLGDGEKFGCKISYVVEEDALGTAGGLSLLRKSINRDFIVANCDIISTIDFRMLHQFHEANKAIATVCAKAFSINIPYGTLVTDGNNILQIEEKPEVHFQISSGIYCFSSRVFEFVPDGARLDMPELLKSLISKGLPVKYFQSDEPWMDVGSQENLIKAEQGLKYLTK